MSEKLDISYCLTEEEKKNTAQVQAKQQRCFDES